MSGKELIKVVEKTWGNGWGRLIAIIVIISANSYIVGVKIENLRGAVKYNTMGIMELKDVIKTTMDDRFRGRDGVALEERLNKRIDSVERVIDRYHETKS